MKGTTALPESDTPGSDEIANQHSILLDKEEIGLVDTSNHYQSLDKQGSDSNTPEETPPATSSKPPDSASPESCRYCLEHIEESQNVSSCRCRGLLCRQCLEGELELTHSRGDRTMQCTVCKTPYEVTVKKRIYPAQDFVQFCCQTVHCCGLTRLSEQNTGFGFYCILCGITIWILGTILTLATPLVIRDPWFLFIFIIILDTIVDFTAVWFCYYLRWGAPMYLSMAYFLRALLFCEGWVHNTFELRKSFESDAAIVIIFIVLSFLQSAALLVLACRELILQWLLYRRRTGTLWVGDIMVSNDSAEQNLEELLLSN